MGKTARKLGLDKSASKASTALAKSTQSGRIAAMVGKGAKVANGLAVGVTTVNTA